MDFAHLLCQLDLLRDQLRKGGLHRANRVCISPVDAVDASGALGRARRARLRVGRLEGTGPLLGSGTWRPQRAHHAARVAVGLFGQSSPQPAHKTPRPRSGRTADATPLHTARHVRQQRRREAPLARDVPDTRCCPARCLGRIVAPRCAEQARHELGCVGAGCVGAGCVGAGCGRCDARCRGRPRPARPAGATLAEASPHLVCARADED